MDRIYYNKLIRDKIPVKIKGKGSNLETRVLSDQEFEEELIKKVLEEASELAKASSREELVSELGDIMDVLDEVRVLKNISDEELSTVREESNALKGGFKERLFLVWSSDDDYKKDK